MDNWTYPLMHGVLGVSAVIILGLMVWLAYVIWTQESSPHLDDDQH